MARKVYGGVRTESYKVLEYLESTGTQYCEVDFLPTGSSDNLKIECDVQYTDTSLSAQAIVGRYFTSPTQKYEFGITDTRYFYNIGGGNGSALISPDTNRHTLIVDGIKFYVDNQAFSTNNVTTFSDTTIKPYIFARNNNGGGATWNAKAKLYSAKFYWNDVLSLDLVPAKRISDNVLGLFDKVTKKFYTNKGTGTFTAGSETSEIINVDVAKNVSKIYAGVSGVAKKVVKGYVGVGNVAKPFF